ncbi:cupin domain-containing protein [Rhodovibrionaceae bacterium A322]
MLDAQQIIEKLGLQPHPEGGYFRETYRHSTPEGGRGLSTAIYYLLPEGERSHWHRVDAVEIWHWYGGAPLALSLSSNGQDVETRQLGNDISAGQRPQIIVPADAWQSAESLGSWTLVGCTVSPAFVFEGFELAAPDWMPG